jgi:hypothetical protein
MAASEPVTVRMFGRLYSSRKEAGLPTTVEVEVAEGGTTAHQLAVDLELDLEVIEGVFVNRHVYDLGHAVMPGDRVAFVPRGTPGPHRFYLGLYGAGREEGDPDDDAAAGDAAAAVE